MKKLWSIIFISLFLFIGCGEKEPDIVRLSDSRFNGRFSDGGTTAKYTAYHFDGTNRVVMYSNSYNYIYDTKSDVLECKLSGDIIKFSFWYTGNYFMTYQYYFDDNGNLWLRNIDIDSQFFFKYEKSK